MPKVISQTDSAEKSLQEYKQTKPEQLSLFELILPEEKNYSNTVELYDFIPKYYWGKTEQLRINGEFLRSLDREFECRKKRYKVKIKPASIEQADGTEKYFYPGKREETVEDALRKLVCEGKGHFLDDSAGITFSLYELSEELKSSGHEYSITQIKDALMVCAQTTLVVTSEDGTEVMVSSIFPTLSLQTKEDWKNKGEKTLSFLRFNPLVTRSILERQFRQFNYSKSMGCRSVIARQLHKRMSHNYVQAHIAHPYHISLTTIIRDFGITPYKKISFNLREVETGLKELMENNVVLKFKSSRTHDAKRKNKIVDVLFEITPHPSFVSEMMQANKKMKIVGSKTNG